MELPIPFIEKMRRLLGPSDYPRFESALQEDSPVCVRLNRQKMGNMADDLNWKAVPWCPNGYYLSERPTFTFDPLFHAGSYYVQEASSMFLSLVARTYIHEPSVVLDLCAAPGGKSTLLRSVLPGGSLLVANEVMRQRSQVLAENITKWGHPASIVTSNDPADFKPLVHFFDVILVDAPCSGEGMFRKDPVAVQEWSETNVETCWQRQHRILRDTWGCLKPGGLLIYSTCTFNTQENEETVQWLQQTYGAEVLNVPIEAEWGITNSLLEGYNQPVYRFLPHRTRGEGLFMAVLRKPEDAEEEPCEVSSSRKTKGKRESNKMPVVPTACKQWLAHAAQYDFQWVGTKVCAFPQAFAQERERLYATLNVLCGGIELCSQKGRDLLPEHALAMSIERKSDSFPQVELTYEQAIAYLRHEAVQLSAEAPRGYLLVAYRGAVMGFVKNIGNRANNLYPPEWRIRSGFMPEEIRTL